LVSQKFDDGHFLRLGDLKAISRGMVTTAQAGEESEPRCDEPPSVLQKLQKWGDYEAFGDVVPPTKFVPMKTPLASEILLDWNLESPPRHPLTISLLQEDQECKGRRIGMIIDLSNHETLYGADLKEANILYERVPLVAKVFPTQKAVNSVVEKAEKFWGEHPNDCIAIHCAYGFNRTGFVLCSYLIQVCNFSVQEALDSFAAARPPGVRHEQFIAELHKRYGGCKPDQSVLLHPSFSDLRGYANLNSSQGISSLNSDFRGVADLLTDNHRSIAGRTSGASWSHQSSSLPDAGDDVWGTSPPLQASHRPSFRARSSLAQTSGRSLETNEESVNNESLDLDERDIYEHFARRQEPSGLPITNGQHRRPGLKPVLPKIRGSMDSQRGESSTAPSPSKSSSPFATAQEGEDSFSVAMGTDMQVGTSRSSLEKGNSSQTGGGNLLDPGGTGVSREGSTARAATLQRGPISARITRENSRSSWQRESSDGRDPEGGRRHARLPCTIM